MALLHIGKKVALPQGILLLPTEDCCNRQIYNNGSVNGTSLVCSVQPTQLYLVVLYYIYLECQFYSVVSKKKKDIFTGKQIQIHYRWQICMKF